MEILSLRRWAVLCFLLPTIALGQEPPNGSVRLEVKPVLCVTDNRNPSCDLSFLIMWQSSTIGYYCLFSDFGDGPLRCWAEERLGQMTDERTFDESFTFWMTGEDLASRLAEVDVEVLRLDSDDRRRRRRTRHVWDIN